MMKEWTLRLSTPKCSLKAYFKRAESKTVPEPMTRFFREAGELQGRVGQDVYRVGDDEENALKVPFGDLRNDAFIDGYVFMDEIQSCFAWFLIGAGGDDNDGRIGDVIVGSGIDLHLTGEGDPVGDILCLAVGFRFVGV